MHSIKVKVEQPNIFDMGSNLFQKYVGCIYPMYIGIYNWSWIIHLANGFTYTLSSNDFFGIFL